MVSVNRVAPIVIGQSNAQTIKGSLRFDGSNDYLSKTFGSGNTNTWTWSGWVKKCFTAETTVPSGDGHRGIFTARSSGTNYAQLSIGASGGNYGNYIRFLERDGSGVVGRFDTTQVFRDPSAWFHLVLVWDSSNGTSGDRIRLYINGVRVTSFSTATYPTSSANSVHNTAIAHNLGYDAEGTAYLDGYLSNVTFIDGLALSPYYFGYTDSFTNTWRPKKFKAEGTTVNDGTTWTSNVTTNGGTSWFGGAAANVFDGDISTYVQGALGGDVTFTPTTPIRVKQKLRIWADSGSGFGVGNGPYQISYNGTQIYNGKMWYSPYEIEIASGTELSSLVLDTSAGGEAMRLFAIEVDGIIMKNATTQTLAFGTNGFYLPLDDQNDYTTDRSGKGNNWTANGFTGDFSNPDVVPDSPSGVVGSTKPTSGITTTSSITKPSNYATLNPLDNGGLTLSNGNLQATRSTTSWVNCRHTIGMSSKKWYWEITATSRSTNDGIMPGILNAAGSLSTTVGANSGGYAYNFSSAQKYNNNSASSYGVVVNTGDTVGIAFDADNGLLTFYVNGESQGVAFTGIPAGTYFPATSLTGSSDPSAPIVNINHGQRPFKYQPPAGYLTLCSANARPSTVVTRPDQYVGIVTYTGNGSTQTINVGIKPDLVWVKNRNGSNNNVLQDSVRGFGSSKNLSSNQTQAEGVDVDGVITGNTSNGFTVSVNGYNGNGTNRTNYTYVGWCWKAGGGSGAGGEFWKDDVQYASAAAAGLTAGTITPTGASVGTKQGFSIVKYTGTGSAATLAHGLNAVPSMVIIKDKSGSGGYGWRVYHKSLTSQKVLYLNNQNGESTEANPPYPSAPTSTVINLGTSGGVNSTEDFIMYAWADVPGLQKFGSYTGNGSTDGPFLSCEFRPVFVLIKRYDAGSSNDWYIFDAVRNAYNPINSGLFPSSNLNEYTQTSYDQDFVSNGFKLRNSNTALNTLNATYIYAAFAEAPSFNLYGGQSNAR